MQQFMIRNVYGPTVFVWLWDMLGAEPRLVLNGARYNEGDAFMYLLEIDAARQASVAWRTRVALENGAAQGFKEGRAVVSVGEVINVSPSWIDAADLSAAEVDQTTFAVDLPKPFEGAMDALRGGWVPILPGVSVMAAGNHSYSMNYFNGTYSYNEPFTFVRLDQSIMAQVGQVISTALASVAAALTGQVQLAAAFKFLVDQGGNWLRGVALEPDGSLVIYLANHYCGTRSGGVDLTATPFPGVPHQVWSGLVQGLRVVAG